MPGVTWVDFDGLLAGSDVIALCAPMTEATRALIDARALSKMKKTAFLINTARGGLIVEEDLRRALDEGVIAGAALDVFVAEPLPADHPLLHVRHPERFRFTPHVAWASREALGRLVHQVAENIRGTVLEM